MPFPQHDRRVVRVADPAPAAAVQRPSEPAETFSPGIYEHITEFHGRPVRDFDPDVGIPDVAEVTYRLSLDWEAAEKGVTFDSIFQAYVNAPNASESVGLVIGSWDNPTENSAKGVVKAIASAGDKLGGLISFSEMVTVPNGTKISPPLLVGEGF